MTTFDRLGCDLQVGDVLVWVGQRRPITHFLDHPRSLLGAAARIACSGPGWGITVLPDTPVRVEIPAPSQAALDVA